MLAAVGSMFVLEENFSGILRRDAIHVLASATEGGSRMNQQERKQRPVTKDQ